MLIYYATGDSCQEMKFYMEVKLKAVFGGVVLLIMLSLNLGLMRHLECLQKCNVALIT